MVELNLDVLTAIFRAVIEGIDPVPQLGRMLDDVRAFEAAFSARARTLSSLSLVSLLWRELAEEELRSFFYVTPSSDVRLGEKLASHKAHLGTPRIRRVVFGKDSGYGSELELWWRNLRCGTAAFEWISSSHSKVS